MVDEECANGPHGAEDGDDKEDEDGGGRELVVVGIDVDEVGEHAQGGDLWVRCG